MTFISRKGIRQPIDVKDCKENNEELLKANLRRTLVELEEKTSTVETETNALRSTLCEMNERNEKIRKQGRNQ